MPLQLGPQGGFFATPDADVLAVLLHAYDQTPASLEPVAEVVRDAHPDSDLFAPLLPVSILSFSDPEQVARELVASIDRLWRERVAQPGAPGYRRIVLIGHSLGAVLARKVWALAWGATAAAEVDRDRIRPWARCIGRIVLLAATNRGWMVSSAFSPFDRLRWTLGAGLGNFCRLVLRREPLIFGFRRGAPFLTTTRLQCLAVAAWLRAQGDDQPVTVQLLGTADDYVAPTDNIDLATARDFYYLEVTAATHKGIVSLAQGNARERFRTALDADASELKAKSLEMADVFDLFEENVDDHDASGLPTENRKVTHVVFVIHGIRDRGFWTRRIARRIKQLARDRGGLCRSVTSTYGYFPLGPFLLPWMRRAKVEWLLDQYVTAKALYPCAEFAYVGHSNGTYLLAKALELCRAVRFGRVVFAGSVVPCGYRWQRFLPASPAAGAEAQIRGLVNYVATADWVVAIFPHGLERLRLQDLGGAGHRGFLEPGAGVTNVRHAQGGHSAALVAEHWDEMAAFVLGGPAPPAERGTQPDGRVARLGRFSPALWAVLIVVIAGIAGLILAPLGVLGSLLALLFVLYLGLLRLIATRA